MSKVVVANDHGAVELTATIVEFLKSRGFEVNYLGTSENRSVDYPDMAELACTEFLKGDYEFGVLCYLAWMYGSSFLMRLSSS